jgi:hypothetical protein
VVLEALDGFENDQRIVTMLSVGDRRARAAAIRQEMRASALLSAPETAP